MKYYIIAGEASGDLHAANLIASLKQNDKTAEIRAWGGDLMEKQGAKLVKHYRDLAFMGFWEVTKHFGKIINNLHFCKKDILHYNPDCIILVDYPGFNLKIAKFASTHHYKVFYYISPQVWAWKKRRVSLIEKYVNKLFVILPFETDFYKNYNVNVEYVGHPLLDEINQIKPVDSERFIKVNKLKTNKEIIALLPGSRRQEIETVLRIMLKVVPLMPQYQFVIAGAPSINLKLYKSIIGRSNIRIVRNQTYALLQMSSAALVTSGTATLETALLNVPEVVCYKTSKLTYAIAKKLVKVKFISLPNLIMDKEVVIELIQNDCTAQNMKEELNLILHNGKRQKNILENYEELRSILGEYNPSETTSKSIISALQKK